jgi:NAD(P)-dependent dehydrogenase (short-subunit alcohol dehydrogenase family)
MQVNLMGPVKMTEAFLQHVAASTLKTVAVISSVLGSIARSDGRLYIYRTSKAAVNMAVKSLAVELKSRGFIVIALHPGWVKTDMGGPDADITPAESVRGLRKVLGALGPEDSGRLVAYNGEEIPW